MRVEKYTARSGKEQVRPVMTELEVRRFSHDEMVGFCLACGADAECCEPDTRRRKCEQCQQLKVYAFEELLMMGLVRLEDENDVSETAGNGQRDRGGSR